MQIELNQNILDKILELLTVALSNTPNKNAYDQIMNYDQLAEYLNISKRKLVELKNNNKIPFKEIDGSVRFSKQAIDEWMECEK
ncbi:MAG: excisionase family DNA-binding protein [Candidatus Marinimicrobia bacterium]|nr:excisionase family DNA-binding protein [Candidatus Neomarinimicrobiota bacterium]